MHCNLAVALVSPWVLASINPAPVLDQPCSECCDFHCSLLFAYTGPLDPPKSGILSNIRYWYFVDLMAVCIHDGDEPSAPIPSRHDRAVFEATCQRYRILASGSIACEINAFVIIQNLSSVGEVEVVTRHCEMIPIYVANQERPQPLAKLRGVVQLGPP